MKPGKTIQMVGVFGVGKDVCFGPPEWDRRLEILDCSDSPGWFGDCLGVVLIVCL